jgi:hypothetical protein
MEFLVDLEYGDFLTKVTVHISARGKIKGSRCSTDGRMVETR